MRIRTLLAAVALAAAPMLPASPAHAASLDVTCTGTETVNYYPGLLLTPRATAAHVTGVLAPCTSSDRAITAGTYGEAFTTTLSCSTLLAGRAGTRVFTWSDGQTSTLTFNRALNNVGGQTTVTFTGEITSGKFAGDTAVEQVVFVTPNLLQCLTPPGLTTLGPGLVVLTIVHP